MASVTLTSAGTTASTTFASATLTSARVSAASASSVTITEAAVVGASPAATATVNIIQAAWLGSTVGASVSLTSAAVSPPPAVVDPGNPGDPGGRPALYVRVNGVWVAALSGRVRVGGAWVVPGSTAPGPVTHASVAFTSARAAGQLVVIPPSGGGGWNPVTTPMARPDRGSDPRVGGGQLNIVWYEDLFVTGDTLSGAMARLTTPAVISFPEGRFVTRDFATNGSLYATVVPKNCLGIWGSGRGSVGSNVGTIFSMVPNSSTKAGNVPVQDNSTPVQMRNMMHIGPTGTELSYGQFHVEGVDQGHIYHNFTVYSPPGKVTMVDILSNGHYGNNGAPPGETFGIEILGNNNNLTDPSVTRCEVDGRRAIGGPNYGAVGLDYENLVRGSWTNCYAHHTNFASTVCFQSFNITSSNMLCGDPSDTDGNGIDGRNAGGWMNHERTGGCIHTNPTLFRVFKNIGKSVHITHSNDSYVRGGFSSANATIRIINPTFNDIWGDNSLYIQSWHPYWTGCSMVGNNNTGIPAAPFAVNTDGSPLVKYKYVHTPGNGGFTVANGFQPGQRWNSFVAPATTPGPNHAFTP